jgi:hypothetical protein
MTREKQMERALKQVRKMIERDHKNNCAKKLLGIGCLWCEALTIIDAASL